MKKIIGLKSIRSRLFIQISVLILILVAVIILFNSIFLENYYLSTQETSLISSYETINAIEDESYGDALDVFIGIESNSNVDIALFDSYGESVYTSNNYLNNEIFKGQIQKRLPYFEKPGNLPLRPRQEEGGQLQNKAGGQGMGQGFGRIRESEIAQGPIPLTNVELKTNTDSYSTLTGIDPLTNGKSLALLSYLDNGHYLILRMPMASIRSSIMVMNQFFILIGVILLVIAGIYTFILSGSFTKPIRAMNQATKRLTSLDFSETCDVVTQDELGELAGNINVMSESLNQNITSLKELVNSVSHELKTPPFH